MLNPESWTPDAWMQFLQENWVVVAIAVVAIFIIMKLVKTVLKWVIVAAIIIGIVAYGGYSIEDIKALGSQVESTAKEQILKAAVGDISKAKYTDNGDGSYTIKTPSLELRGKPDSGEVAVLFEGVPAGTWKVEGPIRDLIEQSRKAAS